MTHSQQVLAALLATPNNDSSSLPSTQPSTQTQSQVSQPQAHLPSQLQSLPPPNVNFSATLVTPQPSITSVQTFNVQLAIGGKDEALRHAAGLFKASAKSIERTRLAGEKYWVDALKIRRNNWGLVPAPLPPGSATGKGADKTSKDFLISFGLEEC
jgi:mediator of RNA polymerase II transcription subunit 17